MRIWQASIILLVSNWSATACPDACNCANNDKNVTCIQTDLAEMPILLSPRLESLTLRFNNINLISQTSLMFYTKLVTTDLSYNQIVTIRDSSFTRSFNLKKLNLEGNNILEVTNQTFAGLSKLQILNLRKNEISSFPVGVFSSNVPSLVDLDLSGNRIAEIRTGVFDGLSALKMLNLADNLLPAVPSEALASLPYLAELHLSGNLLKTLPGSAFSYFLKLTTLELSSSLISFVHNDAFKGLSRSLRKLKLADNDIEDIPSDAFNDLPELHALDIGRNPFHLIPRGAFSNLKMLKKIEITGCGSLVQILNGAFEHCLDLEHIVISQNRKLAIIEHNSFDAAPSIKTANFEDNQLSFLPEALLPWSLLKQLKLSGNPWLCGECDTILFISRVYARNPVLLTNNGGLCALPNEAKKIPLIKAIITGEDDKMTACEEKTNHVELAGKRENQNQGLARRSNSVAITVSLCVFTLVIIVVFISVAIRFRPTIGKCFSVTTRRSTRPHGRVIAVSANDRLDGKIDKYDCKEPKGIHFASVTTSTSSESSFSPTQSVKE